MASTKPRSSSSSRISPENFERLPSGPAGATSAIRTKSRAAMTSRSTRGAPMPARRFTLPPTDRDQHNVKNDDITEERGERFARREQKDTSEDEAEEGGKYQPT